MVLWKRLADIMQVLGVADLPSICAKRVLVVLCKMVTIVFGVGLNYGGWQCRCWQFVVILSSEM